jgi:outer membrane protein, heavy metal efflux system
MFLVEPLLSGSPTIRGPVPHVQEKTMFPIATTNFAARLSRVTFSRSISVVLLSAIFAGHAFAQESVLPHTGAVTPLAELLAEAEKNNPQIEAARQGWQAAKQVPTQVSTLPDPQFTLQHLSVGSPRPFAGYTNSDFAYIGLGVTQDIPYPGKLRLKGEIARREADVSQQQVESMRRAVLAEVKAAYFQLAYLSKTLAILESDGELLRQVEQAADARYRSGMGTQQDVLQAQLQKTKLIREIAMHHLEVGKLEAQLKQFLNRPQDSPDIEPADSAETPLLQTYDELLAAKAQNPELAGAQKMIEKESLQVDLARKDFYPDFNVQYMWQRTDPTQFRAYYMLSFGVRVPIYRGRKQKPELAQAQSEELRARSEFRGPVAPAGIRVAPAVRRSATDHGTPQDSPRRAFSAGAVRVPSRSRSLPIEQAGFPGGVDFVFGCAASRRRVLAEPRGVRDRRGGSRLAASGLRNPAFVCSFSLNIFRGGDARSRLP